MCEYIHMCRYRYIHIYMYITCIYIYIYICTYICIGMLMNMSMYTSVAMEKKDRLKRDLLEGVLTGYRRQGFVTAV